jgi:multiple sugar transport system substrate-binding protein
MGQEATRQMIAEFEAANPMIKVTGVPTPATIASVQADVAAGKEVDLAQIVFSDLDYAVENFGAQALEDIVPADELKAHEEGMSPNGLKLGVINDKTWALAYTFSTPVLFYNADLFKQAGLDPDHPPQTWDEVKQAALAIQQKTGARGFDGGIIGAGASGSDWLVQSVVMGNGGRTLSEDRTRLMFAEPEAVGAIQMLRGLHDAGVFPNDAINDMVGAMSAGKLGMLLNTSVLQAALIAGIGDKFQLRDTRMPSFPGKTPAPTNSGSGLVIFTSDPVKQRAAWELMKFLTSKRGYTIITSKIGYVPLRPDIVNDPVYLGDWAKAHPLVEPNIEQLAVLQPWVAYPGQNYRQIGKIMMDAFEQAVFSNVDVAETLKAAQDQAQALMP